MNSGNSEPDNIYIGSPDNPRTAAWVCYVTFIGWLLAYFALYRNNKTPFAAFHLRQTLLIHIISLAIKILYSFSLDNRPLFFVISALAVLLFFIWLKGFWDALNNKQIPAPLIGNIAQQLFNSI